MYHIIAQHILVSFRSYVVTVDLCDLNKRSLQIEPTSQPIEQLFVDFFFRCHYLIAIMMIMTTVKMMLCRILMKKQTNLRLMVQQ